MKRWVQCDTETVTFLSPPSKKWGYIALHMLVGQYVSRSVDKP